VAPARSAKSSKRLHTRLALIMDEHCDLFHGRQQTASLFCLLVALVGRTADRLVVGGSRFGGLTTL
jgi:hypothetical protein